MNYSDQIATSNLGLEELKIVSEKAEKALDGCIIRGEILENRLEGLYKQLYRVNIVGFFSVVTALILKFNINLHVPMMFLIPASIFLLGTFAAATVAVCGMIIKKPFPGSAWNNFENHRDVYDKNEAGLLRYAVDSCFYKIQAMVAVCEHKTRHFIYSLWIISLTTLLSLSVAVVILSCN